MDLHVLESPSTSVANPSRDTRQWDKAMSATPKSKKSQIKRNTPLQHTARKVILDVFENILAENEDKTINWALERTAFLVNRSVATIKRIRKEFKENKELHTPGKKRPGAGRKPRMEKYDSFTLTCVRRKVHSYFARNEIPTLDKLYKHLNGDKEIFPDEVSRSTLHRILKDLGFEYRRRGRQSGLIDRDDIIVWRRNYLRTLKRYREEKKDVYYLDETWCNAGHTMSKVWQDTTIKSHHQAKKANLTTGLSNPSGKGSRLIVTHAGSQDGFVKGAVDIFEGKKTGDYHQEMDGQYFEEWFKNKLLPNLKPNSVIVMDNASYHSVKLEKVPNTSTRKKEIQDWLTQKGIPWSPDMVKAELLKEVAVVKKNFDSYRIDTIASDAGHTVLRIPPYHCELNPIELIWAQIKGSVAAKNTTFKLPEVQQLLNDAIGSITTKNWQNALDHTLKEEQKFFEMDGIIDDVWDSQSLIINLADDSDVNSDMSECDDPEMSETFCTALDVDEDEVQDLF